MKKIGFIGMGNMAQAICIGIIESGKVDAKDIYSFAPNQEKLAKNAERIGFTPCASLKELAGFADTLIMGCKPYQIESIVAEIGEELKGKALVSIAAGWSLDKYRQILTDETRVQYIMPNTPAMVNAGVFMFEKENTLTPEEHAEVMDIFAEMGLVTELPSNLMNIGMAIAGCGPAFIDLIIEALGDAGVKYGLQRAQSYELASQMILGTAKLQLETGEHPGVLKDNVCSPAGTTIVGVDALEHNAVRAAFIDAVDAVMDKSRG
ncbi:MAG: pyrroline-5-carboxylate reductase [Firmicutes bacterium]|nr:pyrroline-5-carboxylate reductase [Bacillota bacterium]